MGGIAADYTLGKIAVLGSFASLAAALRKDQAA
jgi:hypothetical protein